VVREPTRGDYLLDLALTDLDEVRCKIQPKIADHKGLWITLPLHVPETEWVERTVWHFKAADWDGLRKALEQHDWSPLQVECANEAAQLLTNTVLAIASGFIPKAVLRERKSTHPWVNQRVIKLVLEKRSAEGTDLEAECASQCSAGILEEYQKYIVKEKVALQAMPKGTRGWWSRSRRLMRRKGVVSSVPALREEGCAWVLEPQAKADLLATTFTKKFLMAPARQNEYSKLEAATHGAQTCLKEVSEKVVQKEMEALKENSSTGPDLLPTRILRECAAALAKAVLILFNIILDTGVWPDIWRQHWIVPLFKKNSVFNPSNYRGVHLTAQLSKVLERVLQALYAPFLSSVGGYGPNQFAYSKERGARDVLAMLVLTWVTNLVRGFKIGIYCSDVSGAFDRVSVDRLAAKLRRRRLHPRVVRVLVSWLQQRHAHVVVSGTESFAMKLFNMLYQGTVLGPQLWNAFFEDASVPINEWLFTEVVFADDLNAYRAFPATTADATIQATISKCQEELHTWGEANQVVFDPCKESKHIMCLDQPLGTTFKLLGVLFDDGLMMAEAVSQLVCEAGWKVRALLRTRAYFSDAELIMLYKSHLLGFLEYRTAAIYHATRNVLEQLDAVQTRFLRKAGVNEVDALVHFRLAPLAVRRDMAMLGLIHRTVLKKGPDHFKSIFRVTSASAHGRPIVEDMRTSLKHPLVKRSALGLAAIYNRLPASFVMTRSVSSFQRKLQQFVTERACAGCADWRETLSPRLPLDGHPVLSADVMEI